jgi:hypothetical protein
MEPTYHPLSLATLETVNRVARAAHLWIRHKQAIRPFTPSPATELTHNELAAGVISGVCDALALDGQHALLAAYAYALLDGEDEQALNTARALLSQHRTVAEAAAYRDGKLTALEIIAVVQFELPADVPSVDFYPETGGNRIVDQAGNH